MKCFSTTPIAMGESLWCNRNLIRVLVVRDILGRYKGSFFGVFWALFNPVLMLTVYTFVFSVIFNARWGNSSESKAQFAIVLFVGLIVFNLFAECIIRSPALILVNINYVKRVVFPLEVLPWVSLGSGMFHALVSFAVWLLFSFFVIGIPHPTILLFLLVMVPLTLLIMGFSWFLASIGVFVRDVGQIVGVLITLLMFISPIFYPISAIPEKYRMIIYLNPLTFIIEQARAMLIFGQFPDWNRLGLLTCLSFIVAWLGFAWFQKTRKGFADVL